MNEPSFIGFGGDVVMTSPEDDSLKNVFKCTKCGRPYLATFESNTGLCRECMKSEATEIPFSIVIPIEEMA